MHLAVLGYDEIHVLCNLFRRLTGQHRPILNQRFDVQAYTTPSAIEVTRHYPGENLPSFQPHANAIVAPRKRLVQTPPSREHAGRQPSLGPTRRATPALTTFARAQ